MAAAEQERQPIVRLCRGHVLLLREQGELGSVGLLPSQPVEGIVPCRLHQPASRARRDARAAPLAQRLLDRLRGRLLGDVEAPRRDRQRRDDPCRPLADQPGELAIGCRGAGALAARRRGILRGHCSNWL
jgi:hypothetical protein